MSKYELQPRNIADQLPFTEYTKMPSIDATIAKVIDFTELPTMTRDGGIRFLHGMRHKFTRANAFESGDLLQINFYRDTKSWEYRFNPDGTIECDEYEDS